MCNQKLRIAFDQQVFLLQEYGGISRYVCSLATQLSSMSGIDVRVVAPLHVNRTLGASAGIRGRSLCIPGLRGKALRLAMMASGFLARRAIGGFAPDIVHETYFSVDDYRPRGAKRVLTVYDMIHERFADMFERSHMTSGPKRVAALRADHVICISHNTRRDLVELFGVPEEKTSVVYLGVEDTFLTSSDAVPPQGEIGPPFLLYVGSRGGYKNFAAFVQAVGRSSELRENFSIICFGGGSLRDDELSTIAASGLRPGQVVQKSGDDHALMLLYRRASALVYPSLYEGFGIPPLEAMACSCPVVCSETSSLPEVVGDAGEYFDPRNLESITAAMERVMLSPARRAELIEKGAARHVQFSWRACAEETMAIYRSLM